MNCKDNEVIELSAEEAKRDTPEAVEEYIIEQADAAKLKSGTVIDWKQKLSSRKLWAAVMSAILMCVSAVFGEEMTAEVADVLKTAAYGLIAYVFSEGVVDAAREIGNGKVDAAKELSDVWFHSDTGDGGDSVLRAIPEKNAKEKMAIRRDTACRVRRSIWINNILSEIHLKSDVLFTK